MMIKHGKMANFTFTKPTRATRVQRERKVGNCAVVTGEQSGGNRNLRINISKKT